MKLFGETIGAGATSVTPLYREASDKLKTLDLLQYSICTQLTLIKNDFARESLQSKYTSILMNIMQLIDGQNVTPVSTEVPNTPVVTPTSTIKGSETHAENNHISPVPQSVPALQPQPVPANSDWTYIYDCDKDKVKTDATAIRATNMGESRELDIAKDLAVLASQQELAAAIEVNIRSFIVNQVEDKKKNLTDEMKEEIIKNFNKRIEAGVKRKLVGAEIVCEKYRKEGNVYKYAVTMEIKRENTVRDIYDNIKQDETLSVDNYDKFKNEFDNFMKTYDEN